jgi:hypothetical protein
MHCRNHGAGASRGTGFLCATPKRFSSEAQKALEYVAQRNSIPVEHLLVANEFRRDMPLLARSFQAVTVLDSQSGEFYKVVVDINSGQIDDWLIVSGGER